MLQAVVCFQQPHDESFGLNKASNNYLCQYGLHEKGLFNKLIPKIANLQANNEPHTQLAGTVSQPLYDCTVITDYHAQNSNKFNL